MLCKWRIFCKSGVKEKLLRDLGTLIQVIVYFSGTSNLQLLFDIPTFLTVYFLPIFPNERQHCKGFVNLRCSLFTGWYIHYEAFFAFRIDFIFLQL